MLNVHFIILVQFVLPIDSVEIIIVTVRVVTGKGTVAIRITAIRIRIA
jgi:hypothetical protein